MNKVYSHIESITGNVISVRAANIAYGELAEVTSRYGISLAETIRLDKDLVYLQVFAGGRGVSTGDEVRFLIVRILLGTHEATVAKEFQSRMMQARNAIFYYLKNKDVQFLADEKNAEKLKAELLMVINQYVSDGKFETLLFEEYVVK